MHIPSDEEIRSLHVRYAPTAHALGLIEEHCRIVAAIAEQLIDRSGLDVDRGLVRAGALLHDIGVYALYRPDGELDHAQYIRHGVLGAALLEQEGYPEELCRFCSHHTGVGVTADDVRRQGLPIPEADYTAVSAEEQLVMYADKFHSKSAPPVLVSAETFAASTARFGPDKPARFAALRERFGTPDLASFAEEYGFGLV
ncbi:HD domain-containing protein [Nocardiopsis coralliicola]